MPNILNYFYNIENFKYIQNVDNKIGTIRVYDSIGKNGVNGSVFADEMEYLQNVCDKIHIRYNSTGGSVIDGYSIYSSVINSKVPTKSFIDGLAASTAGWCALAANEVAISDMGTLMVHGASGKPAEMVDLANGSIAKMLQNRSGMSIEETTDLMGKETFYKAFNKKDREFLLDKKIVDEVYTTGKKANIKNSDSLESMANIYNSLINPKKMEKIRNKYNFSASLSEEGVENAVIEKVETLTNELTVANAKIATLEAEKLQAEADAKTALKNKATEYANAQVKAGKLKAADVDATVLNMSKDQASFDFVVNIMGNVESTKEAKKIFNPTNSTNSFNPVNGREDWTIRDWEKKDSKGLAKIKNETPEVYEEMFNAFYKNK